MTFTDDDLKQLKECVSQERGQLRIGLMNYKTKSVEHFYLELLITRLEAAEKVVEDTCLFDGHLWSGSKYIEAWRKAAGK